MTAAQIEKDLRMWKAKWHADDYLKHCTLHSKMHPYRTFFRRLFGYVG
jgi:hypothetical protein